MEDETKTGTDSVPPRVSGKDTREMEMAARKIFSQKKYNWAYEREWRVLGPVGKVKIGAKDVVKSIYLGSRITYGHREAILNAFQGSDVDIFVMNVDGYKHDWDPIQGPKYNNKRKARKKLR